MGRRGVGKKEKKKTTTTHTHTTPPDHALRPSEEARQQLWRKGKRRCRRRAAGEFRGVSVPSLPLPPFLSSAAGPRGGEGRKGSVGERSRNPHPARRRGWGVGLRLPGRGRGRPWPHSRGALGGVRGARGKLPTAGRGGRPPSAAHPLGRRRARQAPARWEPGASPGAEVSGRSAAAGSRKRKNRRQKKGETGRPLAVPSRERGGGSSLK